MGEDELSQTRYAIQRSVERSRAKVPGGVEVKTKPLGKGHLSIGGSRRLGAVVSRVALPPSLVNFSHGKYSSHHQGSSVFTNFKKILDKRYF